MQSTMLKTGEVAEVLGISRQHVVHLCDAGKLPHIKIGSHRRIQRQAIESLLNKPLSEAKARSWWLHAAVFGELVKDPEGTIAQARRNLAMMRTRPPTPPPTSTAGERSWTPVSRRSPEPSSVRTTGRVSCEPTPRSRAC